MQKKILFSGEIPPRSVHGVSYSNEINLKILSKRFKVSIDEELVDFRFHGKFDMRKSFNFIKRIFKIFLLSIFNKFEYLYIVLSTSTVGAIKTLILISIFKLFNRGNIIIHIHRGDLDRFIQAKSVNSKIFYLIEKLASSFIVLSTETKAFLNTRSNINVYVLENTVTHERFLNTAKPIGNGTFDFVYVSNYIEEKGILILLEAFTKLPKNYLLNCYGNFTDLSLKDRIKKYGSYSNIFINPPISGENKFERLYKADALILPSYNEGKPLVLLEAMSVGTPFIATDVGYIKEIPFFNYPYIYSLNTSEELIAIIEKFVKSSENMRISELLKKRYAQKFSNEIHSKKLNQIFNEN